MNMLTWNDDDDDDDDDGDDDDDDGYLHIIQWPDNLSE